jgi:BirA family biotin operon repressor/biotin-[acetyl-CoA-carboxylase] ligase
MDDGLFLWGSGDGHRVAPLTPQTLGAIHTAWNEDVSTFGPWSKLEAPLFGAETSYVLWRAHGVVPEAPVLVCGRCVTSMEVAWTLDGLKPLPDWASVITVEQSAGRGRWHRRWVSPPGNLYVTWIWPRDLDKYGATLAVPELVSLVVGYMLVNALKALNMKVQIKWPNDLFWNDHKIGGILIERKNDRTLVGIGLNLVSAPSNDVLNREGAPPATSLAQAGFHVTPLSGWLALSRLAKICLEEEVSHLPPNAFIEIVEKHLIGIGRRVVVHTGSDKPFSAKIEGLAHDGGLVLERERRQYVLHSGSILFDDGLNCVHGGIAE